MKLHKILTAPISLALALLVRLCAAVLYISAPLLGLVSFLVGLLSVAVLATYSVQNGVILLVIAWLISPVGIPMAAAWLLGKVNDQL